MTDIIFKDALIIIDLIKIKLLPAVLSLPLSFYTTDYIVAEITDEQQQLFLDMCIEIGTIRVMEANAEDITGIEHIFNKIKKLSFADSSVIFFAQKMNAIIFTSDRRIRKEAEDKKIEVHGIFWIFQMLIDNIKITKHEASDKLKELMSINTYLSKEECNKLLQEWKR